MLVCVIFSCGQRLTHGMSLNFKCFHIQKCSRVPLSHHNLKYSMWHKFQIKHSSLHRTDVVSEPYYLKCLSASFSSEINTGNCRRLDSSWGGTGERDWRRGDTVILWTWLLQNVPCQLTSFFFCKMKGLESMKYDIKSMYDVDIIDVHLIRLIVI